MVINVALNYRAHSRQLFFLLLQNHFISIFFFQKGIEDT